MPCGRIVGKSLTQCTAGSKAERRGEERRRGEARRGEERRKEERRGEERKK